MKHLFVYIIILTAAFTMQSCLHDNDDVFDKTAAERIDDAVANAKATLTSAGNGWKFEYYLGSDYIYGGYNMLVQFGNDGKAHLSSEIAASDSVSHSSWDITKDQGPVLTFNTYNTLLHELTQPYPDEVNGYEGDYEFIIMKVTPDTIFLQGKKWGNDMVMTRVPEDMVWKDYLDSIAEVKSHFIYFYQAAIGGEQVDFSLDADKQFTLTTANGNEMKTQYIYTTKGIKLRKALSVNGSNLQYLDYNYNVTDFRKSTLSTRDNALTLEGNVPETYQSFLDFGGSYRFTANGRSADVQLYPQETWQGKQYLIRGLLKTDTNEPADIVANYDPVFGRLEIVPQYLGSDSNGLPVYLFAWAIDPATGSGGISTSDGIYFKWNGDAENPSYTIEPISTFKANSFILFTYVNGDYDVCESWSFVTSGDYRFAFMTSLTKL